MHTESLKIAVINPNSNPVYTDHISRAVEPERRHNGVSIDCLTLHEGPLAIESDADVAAVIDPICNLVNQLESIVAGFVIACFADPGLREARRITARPVAGCCEAAVTAASSYGGRFGLISTGDDVDADRELMFAYKEDIESLAIANPGIPTADIPTDPSAVQKMNRCVADLQAQDVDVIVLGCAGMALYAKRLQRIATVPVIEPVLAAVQLVLQSLNEEEFTHDAKDQSKAIA